MLFQCLFHFQNCLFCVICTNVFFIDFIGIPNLRDQGKLFIYLGLHILIFFYLLFCCIKLDKPVQNPLCFCDRIAFFITILFCFDAFLLHFTGTIFQPYAQCFQTLEKLIQPGDLTCFYQFFAGSELICIFIFLRYPNAACVPLTLRFQNCDFSVFFSLPVPKFIHDFLIHFRVKKLPEYHFFVI